MLDLTPTPTLPSAEITLSPAAARLGGGVRVVPAEAVTLLRVALPVRGRRQRLQALPFALEEHLGRPVDLLHCALHPGGGAGPDVLAAVVDRAVMDAAPERPAIPEAMAIPAPAATDRPVWSVWATGPRALVRASDGTGFACRADALPALWALAGRPAVLRLGDALPEPMGAEDLSDAPPAPDRADLAFDLRQGRYDTEAGAWAGVLRFAAVAAGIGLLLALLIAVADRAALARIAAEETRRVEAALSARVPGLTLAAGPGPVIARLAPRAATATGSEFLPLLTRTSEALSDGNPPVDLRRLTWDAQGGALVMDLSSRTLEDIQTVERALQGAGLTAQSGVATAGDGAARADITVRLP